MSTRARKTKLVVPVERARGAGRGPADAIEVELTGPVTRAHVKALRWLADFLDEGVARA